MEVHEKVEIKIGDQKGCLAGRVEQAPDRSFLLIPTDSPKLVDTFKQIRCNCVEKRIYAVVEETPRFEAYQWFSKLNENYNKSQNTSFSEASSISLYFFDDDKHEDSGGFKFSQLKLADHSCEAFKEDPDCGIFHDIVIEYKECKSVFFRNADLETKIDYSTDPNAKIDDEWRAIRIEK
jgi:hypothetical protein